MKYHYANEEINKSSNIGQHGFALIVQGDELVLFPPLLYKKIITGLGGQFSFLTNGVRQSML
jgi:hypothetical protein